MGNTNVFHTSFSDELSSEIVNVQFVPQRSPFRYPGGKTWLVPKIRQWLQTIKNKPHEFVEPFAGGGIVGLTVAFENLADHVLLIELDEEVASVWKTVLNGEAEWLADKIVSFNLTHENLKFVLSSNDNSVRAKAFKTILRNRVNRGGILAPGAGIVKNGENGKGIKSRWYPVTLKKRILAINDIKDKMSFFECDGMEVMKQKANKKDVVFFIDPPYTASSKRAGSRLYKYHDLNHRKLFELTSQVQGDFLMTYDNAEEVISLAKEFNFDYELIPMKNTHHVKMTELLIGKRLDWLRNTKQLHLS